MNLNNIKSGFNLSKINENFQRIAELANDQVLYRKPPTGQPNQMEVDLDMNGHKVYNNGAPTGPYDLVRWIDVVELGGNVVPGPPPSPAPPPGPGGGGADVRIAIIGDSLSGQQALFDESWPALLEQSLNASGADVQIKNLGINGYTFYSAANTAVFGQKTMVQAAIDYNPHVIIVALGANDSFRASQLGGSAQVIQEAQALFTTLRNALPDTILYYGSTSMVDKKHANFNALANRHIMPAWWQKKTSGLLAGLWCKEIQGDAVAGDIRAAMQYWTQLDAAVKGFQEVAGTITIPLWECARMGLVGSDGLHPGAIGHKMMHGAVRKFLQTNIAFRNLIPSLSDQGGGEFNDWQLVFNGLLQDNGTEYLTKATPAVFVMHTMRQFGPWSAELVDSWFYPSKGSVVSSNLVHNRRAPQVWMIRGSKPNTYVQVTGNETSWLATNLNTDSRGDAIECGSYAGLPNGTYTLRYRVDDEAYGPLTITVSGEEGGGSGTDDFAKKDGSNATGTWPISISGNIEMANLRPLGGVHDVVRWTGDRWAPTTMYCAPGWVFMRETGTSFRIFPINDHLMRISDGNIDILPQNGKVLGLNHSGEFPGAAYTNYYVYWSPAQNRVLCADQLPALIHGIYHYPNDPSFICLARIYTNGAGQMQDTEDFRGVCSTYNQAPRSLKIAPLGASATGMSSGSILDIGSCTYVAAFPGAVLDWTVFGQVGATADASYNRAYLTHDSTCSSTLGGISSMVASHSLRSVVAATNRGSTTTLRSRCESGTTMVMGLTNGLQARGVIHHNW